MKKINLLILVLGLCSFTQATSRKLNPAAHSHGKAQVTVAFDKSVGKVEFEIAAESIVGFEYKPKDEKQKNELAEAIKKFESQINSMVVFDSSLKCEFKKNTIEVRYEQTGQEEHHHGHAHHGEHSDFVASFDITCVKSPIGTLLKINFSKIYPKVKSIELTALVDQIQKSVTKKSAQAEVQIAN